MIRTALAASCLLAGGVGLLLALAACDAFEAQDAFEQDAARPPSGIARTDADGNLISDDPDDWRTAPLYATSFFRVTTRPYPNPVSFTGGQPVNMVVTTGDVIPGGLRIVAFKDGVRRAIPGAQCDVPGPVPCVFTFFASEIPGAQAGDLWRLILFDGQSNVVTYGDLQIEG